MLPHRKLLPPPVDVVRVVDVMAASHDGIGDIIDDFSRPAIGLIHGGARAIAARYASGRTIGAAGTTVRVPIRLEHCNFSPCSALAFSVVARREVRPS